MTLIVEYASVPKKKPEKAEVSEESDTPKAERMQITVTVNTHFLKRLQSMGSEVGRNRSEMIDRAIEEYVIRNEQHYMRQQEPLRPA
jgi:predicted DNA-binding protein